MRTVLRYVPLIGLLAVLALPQGTSAQQAAAPRDTSQTPINRISGYLGQPSKPVGFVPKHLRGSTPVRSSNPFPSSTPARFAGHVTEDQVTAGGTYYEDPETGQLFRSQGDLATMGTAGTMGPVGEIDAMIEQPMADVTYADGTCADGGCGSCTGCVPPACYYPFANGNLQVFGGVQGFTGPANRPDGRGSFGFNEGLNYGLPMPGFPYLAGQVGIRATQSNLSGAEFTDDTRNQGFLTAGLFRRVDAGLQGGVVIDYLSDGWYRDADLTNVRGELSWVSDGCQDIGFWFTSNTKNSVEAAPEGELSETWEATDLFALFYRRQFGDCLQGEARLSVGWSNRSDGYLAVETLLPLTESLSMEANFAYLIPEQGKGTGFEAGHTQESWNIGIGLVWYPGRCMSALNSYYRPLFRVADNGVFMMDRVSP
jgi:hypothetical protein